MISEYRLDYKIFDKPQDVFTYGADITEAYKNLPDIFKSMSTKDDLVKTRDLSNPLELKVKQHQGNVDDG